MGRTTLNIEKDTVLISSSLFKLNQEEADTRAALHCSESTNPVLIKVKEYPFALISPPYDWYLQIDNGKIVNVNIICQNFGKTYLSFILLLSVTPSATSSEYQKHLFSNDC